MSDPISFWADAKEDLRYGLEIDGGSLIGRAISNRGFQALFCYRIAHRLNNTAFGFLGSLLTRLCQIVYSIDIDSRASLSGGIIIYHGFGLVVGQGVRIGKHVVLFHGVTLGIKRSGKRDGFPTIGENVVIGAGAKLLGRINVGPNSVIGANVVLTRDVPARSVVRVEPCRIETLNAEPAPKVLADN